MIRDMSQFLVCPVCLAGSMELSSKGTFEAFSQEFDLEDVDKLEDAIIEQYWVFECSKCGATQKYNFRDIERSARQEISRRVLTMKATGELGPSINEKVKFLIYCGVCNGYDSKGSCPEKVYNSCQLRRIPCGL